MITRKHFIVAGIFITGFASGLFLAKDAGTGQASMPFIGVASAHETNFTESTNARNVSEGKYPSHYAPNTETLAPDEMRVIALGTGMPNARASQAASCWLIELGNGEKFLFDLGTGSMHNFAALGIPYGKVTKAFLSHLHSDHFGDFASWWIGGWVSGRMQGVEVWGPSGESPELGTAYAIEKMQEAYTWDVTSRSGRLNGPGSRVTVHEFDYRAINKVIYEENGVTIRSFPGIHAIDGPVCFVLEWNDLKLVFSGDTIPTNWFIEYGQDADLLIHECFFTVEDLVKKFSWSYSAAINVNLNVHTSPPGFGKILAETRPRHGVAYHFFNDFDTGSAVLEEVRKVYSGPLTLAKDMMVWNVTPDHIEVREIAFNHNSWPAKEIGDASKLPVDKYTPMSEFIESGAVRWHGINTPETALERWPGVKIPGYDPDK